MTYVTSNNSQCDSPDGTYGPIDLWDVRIDRTTPVFPTPSTSLPPFLPSILPQHARGCQRKCVRTEIVVIVRNRKASSQVLIYS